MNEKEMIWAALLHFGTNMWSDQPVKRWGKLAGEDLEMVTAADHLRFDEGVWRRVTAHMAEKRMNMVVIDVGEALRLESHPELAVKGSWTVGRFRAELERLRGMGLEPIPKLNFSTAHDTWLKEYGRMVATPDYYRVCADVIREVYEIFGRPRLFHLGYDEETMRNQKVFAYAVVRQGELWWHDFLYLSGVVEKLGCRPWIWSDYCWHHPEEFLQRMPKSVLQSNWYYGSQFQAETDERQKTRVETFAKLEKAGFDQLPCGSNCYTDGNLGRLVPFCDGIIAPERLKGYMTAPWYFIWPGHEKKNLESIDQLMAARR